VFDSVTNDFEFEAGVFATPKWYLLIHQSSTLYHCLNQNLNGSSHWKQYCDQLFQKRTKVQNNRDLNESKYVDLLLNENCSGSELDIHSASVLHTWNISFQYFQNKSVLTYSVNDIVIADFHFVAIVVKVVICCYTSR
jgi:hypothetical protein